jgi:hypothetical protein
MDIKFHWQRQELERRSIEYTYVPSKSNAADGLTKPHDPQPFYTYKNLARVVELDKFDDDDIRDDGERVDIGI